MSLRALIASKHPIQACSKTLDLRNEDGRIIGLLMMDRCYEASTQTQTLMADQAWVDEIERRVQAIDRGELHLTPWDEVMTAMRERRN